ncbi:MAG: formylglycine-generating enzyme family protein [Planctomycetes bacterium]|nr:formylglycine-generating enzyme family protein [Planctomycetota bacterium]
MKLSRWAPSLLACVAFLPTLRTGAQPTEHKNGIVLDLCRGAKLELIRVPRGKFWMSKDGRNAIQQVEISQDYFIGKFEVTQHQWTALMDRNPSWHAPTGKSSVKVQGIPAEKLSRFPVENVSWHDVQEFLRKLNERDRRKGWEYRLPSEAQWEYACRGAATSQKDCSFHFYFAKPHNDLTDKQANFDGRYPFLAPFQKSGVNLERTTMVGSYPGNQLGLHDMHGNVWEWCDDWLVDGRTKVIRGGSFGYQAGKCRAAERTGYTPSYRDGILGFRVARVPTGR